MTEIDILRDSWRAILDVGEIFPRVFYEVLFDVQPEARALFPIDMRDQRKKLMATLASLVHAARDLDAALPILRRLGADHVRYGAGPDHYPAVGFSLLFTAHHLVPSWTPEIAEVWADTYGTVSGVMIEAAAKIPAPGYVEAEIISVDAGADNVWVWVSSPDEFQLVDRIHVSRSDRVGEWLTGKSGFDGGMGFVEVPTPNTPAGWGMANLPAAGVHLRLAPVYEETDHA